MQPPGLLDCEQSIFVLVILRATGKVSEAKKEGIRGLAARGFVTRYSISIRLRIFASHARKERDCLQSTGLPLRFYISSIQEVMTKIVRVTSNLVALAKLNK